MLIRGEGELHPLSAVVGMPTLEYISPAHLVIYSDELSWLVLLPEQGTLNQVHDGHPWRHHVCGKEGASDGGVARLYVLLCL